MTSDITSTLRARIQRLLGIVLVRYQREATSFWSTSARARGPSWRVVPGLRHDSIAGARSTRRSCARRHSIPQWIYELVQPGHGQPLLLSSRKLYTCRNGIYIGTVARSSTTSDVFNAIAEAHRREILDALIDRKSTRLNSSHANISYAV